MTKREYIKFLRDQAKLLSILADEIEADQEHTISWAIELPLPEYQREIIMREGQEQLTFEHNQHIEKGVA